MNSDTAKIGATLQKYFGEALASKISSRIQPGTTYCVYTDYEGDFTGEYTYFVGEKVSSLDIIHENFQTLTIPAQKYIKFTNDSGPMPKVCIDMWQNIWSMDSRSFEGERSYVADFEVYDQRANDPANTVLDIYIGVK